MIEWRMREDGSLTRGDIDITRLESGMSFLQVKSSMTMKEKLRPIRSAICVNQRKIAHTRLEAVGEPDNPYSLIALFGRGHLVIKAGRAVYVTRCAPVEVVRSPIETAQKRYHPC
jgi:hypothetical protein